MTVIKTPEEAEQVLSSLRIGEETIFNYNPKWRVTRVNGGWLYSSDYNGVTFVPESQQNSTQQNSTQELEAPKAEPKKGGRPPKVMTK